MLFEVPESLVLTISFAVASGGFLTFATAATHYPAHIDRLAKEYEETCHASGSDESSFIDEDIQNLPKRKPVECCGFKCFKAEDEEKRPEKVSKRWWKVAYGTNLTLNAIGGTINLVGTWFGPISLFSPIKQVSQIISGMILFSYVLKTEEKPSKDTSVGNYIIMLSAIMLIFVGPEVREEPIDAIALLSQTKALIFGIILMFLAFVITFPFQFILACTPVPTNEKVTFVLLLLTEVVHAVVGNSCSKLVPLLTGNFAIANMVILVLAIFTITYSSILRSTVILSQTDYLPLMLSVNIFLNGLVGLIIWEDNIINTGGYVCSYFFFIMGIYLISDYDILPGKYLQDEPASITSEEPTNIIVEGLVHGRTRIHSVREAQLSNLRNMVGTGKSDDSSQASKTERDETTTDSSIIYSSRSARRSFRRRPSIIQEIISPSDNASDDNNRPYSA